MQVTKKKKKEREKKSQQQLFNFTFLYRKIRLYRKKQVISFVDAMLRSKILGNRLCILTQILITMDYFFYLYISDKKPSI